MAATDQSPEQHRTLATQEPSIHGSRTMARGAPAFEATVPILSQLLKAELAEREVRSIACHMKSAFVGQTVPRTVF